MRLIVRSGLVLLLALAAATALLVGAGLRDDVQVSDVGVVLGSKVMPDGTPSARLRARLDRAADLYGQGMFAHLIVSGGTGVERFSEARVMARYLAEQRGVPAAAILLDEHGDDTDATARNSAAIMRAHGFASALVVTQYFHIPRSRYALRRANIATVHAAHAHFFEARDIYSTAREIVALPAYWINSLRTS
ncbi:YdcF family protein [Massilia sp. S19_KUP03_FR1]|uniref:YdcF family protein n=1 Tax=Massilia sp. S19_KUP03_FR1 TaxID=3025503 RepID=UPI002FCD92FD